MPSRIPQGTKLGPWLFILRINDLDVDNLANVWKYVDDTIASEVVSKGNWGCVHVIAHKIAEWSMQNRVQLNNDKCKELKISFVKGEPHFVPIAADGYELKRVSGHIKQSHMKQAYSDVIKKVSKCLYFLVQLKRSRVPQQDMSTFYTACIYSVAT